MKDQNKTKAQLIEELAALRQKVTALEADCSAQIDLAEHQRIVAKLQQSEQRFRSLVEGSIQGILVHRDSKALFVNQAYANILGYNSPDEILAMDSVVSLIAPYERERLLGYHTARVKGEAAPAQYEYDAVCKDGSTVTLQQLVTIIPWGGELVVLAAIANITERKQTLDQLKNMAARWRSLLQSIPAFVVEIDLEGIIRSLNKVQPGFSVEDFVGKVAHEVTAPAGREAFQDAFRKVVETGQVVQYEAPDFGPHGEPAWYDHQLAPILKENQLTGVIMVVTDITERKQTEKSLRQSVGRLKQAQQLAQIGIWEWDIASDKTTWSDELFLMYGIKPEEFTGRGEDYLNFTHPDDRQVQRDNVQKAFENASQGHAQSGQVSQITPDPQEFRIVRPDGSLCYVRGDAVAIVDEQGKPAQMLGILMDITAEKERAEQLRFQKMLLECQSEVSPDGILIVSNDREWLSFNQRFIEMWEIPDAVVESRSSQKALQSVLDQLAEPEQFLAEIEYLYQHPNKVSRDEITLKDGQVFERHSSPVNNERGENYGRIWYYRNITNRKRMEVNLLESERRLRAAITGSLDAVFLLETKRNEQKEVIDFVFVDLNQNAEKKYGLTRDDFIGRGITEVLPNNRAYGFFEKYIQVLESGVPLEEEYFIPEESIAPGWWRHQVVPMGDGIAIFNRNISAQKQAEIEIRKQFTLNETILDAMVAHVAVLDRDGVIIATNERWADFARENGDPTLQFTDIGQNYLEVCRRVRGRDIEDAQAVLAGLEMILNREATQFSLEYTCHSSREQRWFLLYCSPLPAELGGAVIVHTNITELKQAEFALRASKDRFRNVISSISDHIYVTAIAEDGSKTNLYLSPNVETLLGYPLETFLDDWGFWASTAIHVDDRVAVAVHNAQLVPEETNEIEYRMVRADGEVIWVRDSTRVVDEGGLRTVYGVVSNITERKQAEEKLRESEARYKMLFESVPLPIFTKDREGRYTSSNAENLNYWKQNPIGYTSAELLPAETANQLRAHDLQVMTTGQKLVFEEKLPTEWGVRYMISHKMPLYDADGNIIGILGGSLDITEHKRAEDALRQQEEELRRRNQELTLLNEIIAASAAGLESEDFLEPVCYELAHFINVPQVAVALLNQEKTASTVMAEYRAEERPPALNRVIPVKGNPTARYVFSQKTPLVVDRAQSDRRLAPLRDLMEQRGTAALLIVPLIIAEEVIGTLAFEASAARTFSSDDINLAWSVAGQVAGALTRAEHAKARRMLSAAIEQSADSIVITDTNGDVVYVNPAFENITGYSRAEVIGRNPRFLKSGQQGGAFFRELWSTITAGEVWHGRFINKKKDGTSFTDDSVIVPVHNENGDIVNYVALQRDITHIQQLEEQLRQSQKMEAIGRLAGGVAHDFNNLLTIILGHTELLAASYLNEDDPRLADVNQIRKASERAALLTRQLLAFSRQHPTHVQRLNLNEVVTNLEEMLRRLLGEDLNLIIDLAPDLGDTMADPSHLEQIIVNLAVNARDAMPGGGQLTLKTANIEPDDDRINKFLNLTSDSYIMLTITDTGLGMNEETRSHIFEPFYTTKAPGKGTGLGLAIVYGIVEQNNGHIEVESAMGQGTTFRIYLPQVGQVTKAVSPVEVSSPGTGGNETVLLVEDEDGVRLVIRKYLERQGYTVLEAAHAEEALQICQQRGQRLDLLITDVVMPDISGPELAGQLADAYPGLKCLFISGYADEELKAHKLKHNEVLLLEKPFSSDTLAFKVREALEKSR